jgi:CheY-like chemotaxis protein
MKKIYFLGIPTDKQRTVKRVQNSNMTELAKSTILIVDDSEDAVALMRLELEAAGATVHWAPNEYEAFELLDRVRFDCAIIDIILGEDSTSQGVIKHILNSEGANGRIPIILTSAYLSESYLESLKKKCPIIRSGVKKPFARNQFCEAVTTSLTPEPVAGDAMDDLLSTMNGLFDSDDMEPMDDLEAQLEMIRGQSYDSESQRFAPSKNLSVEAKTILSGLGESESQYALRIKGIQNKLSTELIKVKGARAEKDSNFMRVKSLGTSSKASPYQQRSGEDDNSPVMEAYWDQHIDHDGSPFMDGVSDLYGASNVAKDVKLPDMSGNEFSINQRDSMGLTPLMVFARIGALDDVKKLLDKKADLNLSCRLGKTALHYAAIGGHIDVAELLISRGARTSARDTENRDPLADAVEAGLSDMAQFLLRHGARIEGKSGGKSYLHIAVDHDDFPMLKTLLAAGSNLNSRDEKGKTPIEHARSLKKHKMVQFLEAFRQLQRKRAA